MSGALRPPPSASSVSRSWRSPGLWSQSSSPGSSSSTCTTPTWESTRATSSATAVSSSSPRSSPSSSPGPRVAGRVWTSTSWRRRFRQNRAALPLADPVLEGKRIAEAAAAAGTPLRLLGGVAVALQSPSSQSPPLRRSYGDVDFATVTGARDATVELVSSLGYREDQEFNTLHGHRRLIFWDDENQRHLDGFVEEANLCHRISLHERIDLVPLSLSLADLAVLKLQVVETNEKDYLDICALFADHDLSEDESGINVAYISHLCASDWGLWRTMGM